jgi:tRNA A37 threonylcarbamoyladenosine biosynthesis protein TsaE
MIQKKIIAMMAVTIMVASAAFVLVAEYASADPSVLDKYNQLRY